MSSQRAREQRIVERLQGGALAFASPSDVERPNAGPLGRCHGCLEPDAEVRVGDHSWHGLCALFWKGRSATLRDRRIPHTQPGTGITPARARWVIVVPMDRPDTYSAFRSRYARSPWVDVVVDRRRGVSRPDDGGAPATERRTATRRRPSERAAGPNPDPVFRLAHQVDGCEVYEFTGPESGPCPTCAAVVSVEMPRFVEPPIRLELTVGHEPAPAEKDGVHHVVELQSFSPTGRVLLATQLAARIRESR